MTQAEHYSRNPVVEAVVDLRFMETASPRDLERFRIKLSKEYPAVKARRHVNIHISDNEVTPLSRPLGFQLTAASGVDVIIVESGLLATSRLAPYSDWETLLEKSKRNFETFEKIVGRLTLARIATKFVNRIDIPAALLADKPLIDFLKVGIGLPSGLTDTLDSYGLTLRYKDHSGANVIIASALAVPALIDTVSIQLDIDVFRDADLPIRANDLWSQMDDLRALKNRVFEATITNELRDLIR